MQEFGRLLILLGSVLLVAGFVVLAAGRMGLPIGRLPGDLSFRGKNVTVFAPLGTSLVLSIVLSLLLFLISRFRR